MGMNYFLHRDCCECCGRPGERLFIGKSAGSVFYLKVYLPDFEGGNRESGATIIRTLEEWEPLLSEPKSQVFNELGERVSRSYLMDRITGGDGYEERSDYGGSGW